MKKSKVRVPNADELIKELRLLSIFRTLFAIVVSLRLAALVIALCNSNFNADEQWQFRMLIGIAVLIFATIIVVNGSAKLIRSLRVVEPEPTSKWILVLVLSLSYLGTRDNAGFMLSKLLPRVSDDELKRVDSSIWSRLYRYTVKGSVVDKQVVFDTAVRLSDRGAIPYLMRLIEVKDLQESVRDGLRQSLRKLEE